MAENQKCWLNGKMIPYSEANVSIMTHSLQYGSGIFEGIRAYETPDGPAIFRLDEHVNRFMNTAKIYMMDLGFTREQIKEAIIETVRENHLKSAYIRPFAFYDDSRVGVSTYGKKISVFVGAFEFGKYFSNADAGLKCKISSLRRFDSSSLPTQAKGSGNYLNSVLAMKEARRSGFDEAILLDRNGMVAEGPGENIFLVRDGKLITPGEDSSILLGITRMSLLEVVKDMGIHVTERYVHREEIFVADELFFCGTAAEITPILNVDGTDIGNGKVGSLTSQIREKFFNIVQGKDSKYSKWLTPVNKGK